MKYPKLIVYCLPVILLLNRLCQMLFAIIYIYIYIYIYMYIYCMLLFLLYLLPMYIIY